MKNIILLTVFTFVSLAVYGQQEQQYTQFMYNKLSFNPAYAGSMTSPTLTAIYRNQWMGLEGAPEAQLLSFHKSMINDRVGFGATLSRSSVGINRRLTGNIAYSYRFRLQTGILSLGLQASIRHLRQNWTDSRLNGAHPISTDDAIPMEPKSKIVPNFGAGIFFQNEHYYAGIGIPRLVNNSIDYIELGGGLSREVRHGFIMGGYTFTASDAIEITPQFLLTLVPNAPMDADINVTAKWNKKVSAGLSYRTGSGTTAVAGESLDVLAGFQINPELFFALTYDISLTKLRKYSNGTIEAVARYVIHPEADATEIKNPRDIR